MKKSGRGVSYRKSLIQNLVRSLTTHKKIKTTKSKANHVRTAILKNHGGTVTTAPLSTRRGDGAPMVLVRWIKKEKSHENKNNKKETDQKRLAQSKS